MFSGLATWLFAAGGVLLALIAVYVKGEVNGSRKAEAKQLRERMEARSEADKIDDAVAGKSDAEVMKEQAQWSRKR